MMTLKWEPSLLNDIQVRILGSLIEKELITPDYYPLTLNALTNACNQKSNRDPVLNIDETTIIRALESLKDMHLVGTISGAGIRHQKYRHNFGSLFNLSKDEIAILCVLMLRGYQTLGEIRNRTERMFEFESLEQVEEVINKLIQRNPESLVLKLPLQVNQKESRYAHLLSGEPQISDIQTKKEDAVIQVEAENKKISKLEEEVRNLKNEFSDLKTQVLSFIKQFE